MASASELYLSGVAALNAGQLDQAIEQLTRAAQIEPAAQSFFALGKAFEVAARSRDAIAAYRDAIRLDPNHAEAQCNLGALLGAAGELTAAMAALEAAIRTKPSFALAHYNLGQCYQQLGDLRTAEAAYRKTVSLEDSAMARNSLGVVLESGGAIEKAAIEFQRALKLDPRDVHALQNVARMLMRESRYSDAMQLLHRALQLAPNSAPVHRNIAALYRRIDLPARAVPHYRKALELQPDFASAHSGLLLAMHYQQPLDPQALHAEHLRFAAQHGAPLAPSESPRIADPDPSRRLRIGYVSPDFRTHSVAYFIEPILESHDRAAFEITCYSNTTSPDATTQRLSSLADRFRNIAGLTDARVAQMICDDTIDILVDLAGHTGDNRMLVFARKPAPVQVSYLGYPNTTGLPMIDYRLTDAFADPPGRTESSFVEKLFRLQPSAWCYRPPDDVPEILAPPVLVKGHITFAAFNSFAKVTRAAIETWARILTRVPNSRLVTKSVGLRIPEIRQAFLAQFAELGIGAERVEVLSHDKSTFHHLSRYNDVDLALDTFPYVGTTTTCEALFMGVPVITLAGTMHMSRVGVSLLSNVGLPEFVATSIDDYADRAVALANDHTKLASLRKALRDRMRESPLIKERDFTRELERAYRQMWKTCLESK